LIEADEEAARLELRWRIKTAEAHFSAPPVTPLSD
jgi:hypothetical protein